MSETVNLESLAVVGEKLQQMSDARRDTDPTGSIGLSAGSFVVQQARSEIDRLRTLLSTLMEAVEPFAEHADQFPKGHDPDDIIDVIGLHALRYGDLREEGAAQMRRSHGV